uniref:Uncharacterized protein n=1 Tax=Branchiostoma floridae TaxID=7739 RepID=C3ZQN4_BRAFL|eukprot:XP_002589069.1 hypothetical protein BRAFLDRAFT_120890 [Branchiostoma floridae]
MGTAMINKKGKSGVSSLFPPRRKEDSLHDYVQILVQRSKSNFYKGMLDDQLSCLPDHVRPRVPVTDEVYHRCVTKSVRVRCTKLVFAYESTEEWGVVFRDNVQKRKAEGGYGSLEATYKEAERLWREHSPAYQRCRSVAMPGRLPDGLRNIRRTRRPDETEAEYRRRIRRDVTNCKEQAVRDQLHIDQSAILWREVRPAVHDLLEKLSEEGMAVKILQQDDVRREIASHIKDYQPPQDPIAAMCDLILLEIQRRLFNSNNNEEAS